MVSVAGGSSAVAGSANASNNANPAGASPDGAGCWSSAAGCGATGCSMTGMAGALGCKTGSDKTDSDKTGSEGWLGDVVAGGISLSGCACAGRGAISAMLPAAIRTPWLPSGKSNREQPQVASPPGAAPNPCRRSSRMAPLASNRPASRATCRRCRSAGPKVFSARAAALAAPNRRAPAGLAHRIRLPSAVHSQAGRRLAA